MAKMTQLAYVSQAKGGFTEHQLFDLVDSARAYNEKLGITGILVYNSGHFMQMLEGPATAVNNLFKRIEKDPRHENVERFFYRETDEAMFHSWYMAYKNIQDFRPELRNELIKLIDNTDGSPELSSELGFVRMLRYMRQEF